MRQVVPLRRTLHPSSFILLNIALHTHTHNIPLPMHIITIVMLCFQNLTYCSSRLPSPYNFMFGLPPIPPPFPAPSYFLMCLLSSCVELFCLILLVICLIYQFFILYPYIPGLICHISQSVDSTLYSLLHLPYFPILVLYPYIPCITIFLYKITFLLSVLFLIFSYILILYPYIPGFHLSYFPILILYS